MGLIKCPDCEKLFSDRIDACPNCGCPAAAAIAETTKAQIPTERKTTINEAPVVTIVLPEELTVKNREKSYEEAEEPSTKKLSMGWYNYITKVRPWMSIISFSIIFPFIFMGLVSSISDGTLDELESAIAIFQTLVMIPNFAIQIGLLNKVYSKTITLNVIKSYFIWELIFGTLLSENIIVAVVYFILDYFIWYKCNMKYFRKRLSANCDGNQETRSDIIEDSPAWVKEYNKTIEEITIVQPTTEQRHYSTPSKGRRGRKKQIGTAAKSLLVAAGIIVVTAIVILSIIFIPKESAYQNACKELTNGSPGAALKMFENMNGYRDSEEKINEAKYKYILQNKNNDNRTTFTYLKELKRLDYKDSVEIYEYLYKWRVTEIAVNSSENDEITHKNYISRSNSIYFHFRLTGGEPGESLRITVKSRLPDGSTDECIFDDELMNGETGWYGWDSGLYEYPEYGATGTLQCKFYDEVGNLIGSGSVKISE